MPYISASVRGTPPQTPEVISLLPLHHGCLLSGQNGRHGRSHCCVLEPFSRELQLAFVVPLPLGQHHLLESSIFVHLLPESVGIGLAKWPWIFGFLLSGKAQRPIRILCHLVAKQVLMARTLLVEVMLQCWQVSEERKPFLSLATEAARRAHCMVIVLELFQFLHQSKVPHPRPVRMFHCQVLVRALLVCSSAKRLQYHIV